MAFDIAAAHAGLASRRSRGVLIIVVDDIEIVVSVFCDIRIDKKNEAVPFLWLVGIISNIIISNIIISIIIIIIIIIGHLYDHRLRRGGLRWWFWRPVRGRHLGLDQS